MRIVHLYCCAHMHQEEQVPLNLHKALNSHKTPTNRKVVVHSLFAGVQCIGMYTLCATTSDDQLQWFEICLGCLQEIEMITLLQ